MMRRHKLAATLGTVALVASSVLITAAPASASTTIDNVTFYESGDFGQESSGYPSEDWFFGEVSGTEGSAEFTTRGIEFNGSADGKVQILNQNVGTPGTAAELITMVDGVAVASTAPAAGDDWTFQLPMFFDGGAGFTTLRPNTANSTTTGLLWTTSGAIPATGSTPAYGAGQNDATLSALLDAIYAQAAPPALLAFGFFVNPGAEPIIHAVRWDGDFSAFTPVFDPQVAPLTITTTDLADPAKGLRISFAGSLADSDAYTDGVGYIYISNEAGDEVYFDDTVSVNADGTFDLRINPTLPPGKYSVYVDDDGYAYYFLGLSRTYEVTVVAALAATGVDATIPAGVAIFTLLGGALALFYSRRRSARA